MADSTMEINQLGMSEEAGELQNCSSNVRSIPVLGLAEIIQRLQNEAKSNKFKLFRSMYSSLVGAITTDVAAMVLPLDNHMVHRGHSVFDTAILTNGHLYELDAHLDRFLRSAAAAKITPPFDRATIRDILIQTVAAGECKNGILRYWLSVGRGGLNLSALECDKSLMYAILVDENHIDDECKTGIKVITSREPIKDPKFATIKTTNYLPNALVMCEAEDKGASAGIWLDNEGYIAEGQTMNIGVISKEGELLLPPFDNILSGCTARRAMELVPELVKANAVPGLKGVKLKNITLKEAKEAPEVMLLSSGVLVMPVVEWDGKPIGNGEVGPITLALRAAIQKDMKSANLTPVPQRASAYPVPLDASVDDLLLRNATTRLQQLRLEFQVMWGPLLCQNKNRTSLVSPGTTLNIVFSVTNSICLAQY